MLAFNQNDTICAVATASGVGAIGIIRISGDKALEISSKVFTKDLTRVPTHTLHFGRVIGSTQKNSIDEVVASVYVAPKSYTGEHTVEFSCHGSPYIQQEIIAELLQNGCRLAEPGEFTLRAFLNKKLDLSQAEAVADLIASDSKASHELAMQQMRGGFSAKIKSLREQLIHFASLIELELDFGEEDVEFANRDDLKQLILQIHSVLQQLIDSFKLGNVLKNGIPVVIAGKPNAGKSTLLNALLNEERAIVSSIEGTTRDVIEDEVNINGIVYRFIDTAGIRETTDEVEAIGVKRTLEKMKQAAIVLYLFDSQTMQLTELEQIVKELEGSVKEGSKVVLVANKSDLIGVDHKAAIEQAFQPIFISAKNDSGIDKLLSIMQEFVQLGSVSAGDVVVSNARHHDALRLANERLMSAFNGLENGITGDFLAMDIRQSLYYLGLVTGEVTTDDLLDNIFSKFCIGK